MVDNFQQQLHQVIALSQKILLALSSAFENTVEKNDTSTTEVEPEQLIALNAERDKLIKFVFNEQQSQNYNQHIDLINEIIALDHQLIQQATTNKLTLRTNLLTIKKNKKAAKSYNNY